MITGIKGEFSLIKNIFKTIGNHRDLIRVIGDDAAVLKYSATKNLLLTCDCLIEDNHFKKTWLDPFLLGRKAALANFSDIAAMGGKPKYALISLGLPKNISSKLVDQLYGGLKQEFKAAKTIISGGNIVRSTKIFIDVFLTGEIKAGLAIYRFGAKKGDWLAVTGSLGEAGAGLKILNKNYKTYKAYQKKLINRFWLPPNNLSIGQLLAKHKLATSMIDISDGLSGDLFKLGKASKVGLELWENKLPISNNLNKLALELKLNPYELALDSGEDYELLFTVSPENLSELKRQIKRSKIKVTIIGRIKPERFGIRIVRNCGEVEQLVDNSWDHLRNEKNTAL